MAVVNKVTIEIAGNNIPDFVHLTIGQTINQPHDFQLVCRRDKIEKSGDSSLSSIIKEIGSVITFSIEGVDSGVDTKDFYFKGIITDIRISESLSKEEITFTGHSPDILLHGYPACRSFENKKLKQIVEEVIMPYPKDQISLTGDPSNDGQYPYIVQYNETNYEFLRRLSARMGEWFFYNGQKLIFGDYERTSTKGVLGINLSNLSIGTRIVPLKFKLYRYIFQTTNHVVLKSSEADITDNLNAIGKQVYDQSLNSYPEEAVNYSPVEFINDDGSGIASKPGPSFKKRAKQMMASKMVEVSGNCSEPLGPGNVLKIKSLNSSHNETDIGDYLVTSVRHNFDNSMNYQNSFSGIPAEINITPESDVNASAWCDTQSAYVVDNNDPQKWGRVRVRFMWQAEGQKTPWIRTVDLHGGQDSGSYFVPEINSEVLVGFEGGDPQRPYVIGSVRNSLWKPNEKWVTKSNDFKIIKTRSGHIIKFNDTEGSGKITIEAHGDIELMGNNIRLTAQDTVEINGKKSLNLITDEGGVISIQSQNTKITIDDNNIDIEANEGVIGIAVGNNSLTIDPGGNTVTGAKTEIKGDGEVKINSSGIVEIQGSIVKIN